MRGVPGCWRVTVIAPGVLVMVPAAADDGLAGDGAVFVVVAQVGVELVRQPVLGVVREQPQHHLQAAAAGPQQRDFGFRADDIGGARRLMVARSAVLDSGDRQVVFVDRGGGNFEPRQVKIGQQSGDRIEILSGLAAGERIVTSGNFLIDSESQLKAAMNGMSK